MSVLPSMVHRSGDTLVVRSVVSGDPLYEDVAVPSYASTPITGGATSDKLVFYTGHHNHRKRVAEDDDLPPRKDTTDLPECKVKRNYSCATCDYFTQNPRKYLYHLRDVHREKVKVYECPSCLYASKHYQKLLRHTRMVHGRNATVTQDKRNAKISANAITATSHSRRKRGGGIGAVVVVKEESFSGCDEALQTSPRPADDEEQDGGEGEEDEAAEEDDDQSNDVDELLHVTVQDGGRGGGADAGHVKFRCALCSYVAKGQQQLTKHESEVHIRTKFFRCTKCSYVTHIKARYTKHVKYHSMPMIKCDLCDFRTPYKWNLDRHCKNHNGRGAFRCSACNFTADIKQSLTVHEMNHHVPPVGQAAIAAAAAAAAAAAGTTTATTTSCATGAAGGAPVAAVTAAAAGVAVSTSRRRNKVGASDSICAAENQVEDYHQGKQQRTSQKNPTDLLSYRNTSSVTTTTAAAYTSADFVHPDDIVERPNGHIYLKSQCKLCNFKTAYDSEMVKHERTHHSATATFPHHHHHRHHSISTAASCKPRRTGRPVPNLIPIRSPPNMLSAKELHDITIGSSNSALKDYAPLFDSEELFRPQQQQALQPVDPNFKEKNASFFDKLKEKLLSHDSSTELICQRCGHESKCWTESVSHLKMCGKEMTVDRLADNGTPPLHNNNNISSVLSSTRCQYCRQRCKSSADLYVHMQTCTKYQQESELFGDEEEDEEAEHMEIEMRPEDILSVEEQQHDSGDSQHQQPHPMENRVFVWNDIEVPMNIGMDDVDLHQHQHQLIPQQQQHHHQHQPQQADFNAYYHLMENAMKQNALVDDDDVDAVSLDLSIRTQSPVSEATPPHPTTKPTKQSQTGQNSTNMFGKVPTHGNDISIAQHKRVFKCPHCSFWASTASRFHVHIVGHLNKKPFECSLCAYRSNWRWDITKHIKLKSVRDPNHETARVLMTDETGRRNYTKYNKYLTEINMPNGSGADAAAPTAANVSLPSRGKHQHVDDSTSLAIAGDGKHHNKRPPPDLRAANSDCITVARFAAALSAQTTRATLSGERDGGKKRALGVESAGPVSGYTGESRRPMYKCAKYISKDRSQEKRVETTETHYTAQTLLSLNNNNDDSGAVDITCQPDMQQLLLPAVLPRAASGTITPSSDGSCDTSMDMRLSSPSQHDDCMAGGGGVVGDQMTTPAAAARGGSAPFSCGHCHQRHCRLKHHGDISVIVGGRAGHPDRVESDRQPDEPEHMDMPQLGAHKCPHCPYSTDVDAELAAHAVGHVAVAMAGDAAASSPRCPICDYTVAHLAEIYAHLPLHGIGDPVEYMQRVSESDPSKRHKCTACPYVTNSKSQYMYHKRFHKPKNGQYKCSKCNYNVSRRHLLHQHMKVHSVGKAEYIDLEEYEELTDSGAEMPLSVSEQPLSPPPPPLSSSSPRTRTHSTNNCGGGGGAAAAISADIPLIWVSRGGNFSKMYKCRHCPHVNSRKVNIQEHEKMHAASSGNAADSGGGGVVAAAVKVEGEHHCAQCDYVCNNAGVLSSHTKVHQGAFGVLHCLVDPQKSDEDQIRTLTISLHQMPKYQQQQQQQHLLAAAGLMIPPPPPLTSDDAAVEEDEVLEPPTDVNLAASLAESGDMLYFCHECPARFLKAKEFEIHRKLHGGRLFYKCNYCTYTGRQRPHLNAHAVVHTTEYKKRTANLRSIYRTHPVHTAPALSLVYPDSDHWVVAKSPAGDVNTTATSATTSDTISVELDSDTDINDNNIHDVDATTTGPSIALTNTLLSATRNTLTSSKDHHGVVPLSGTDLFRHRQMAVDAAAAESRKKLADNYSRAAQTKDNSRLAGVEDVDAAAPDQFGAGNPEFIYPMCTKNGRQKEKRYKCAKCPTAFEKREQYKVHLGLHGSKQRFQCDECDYSVANSSNFVQHQRKHIAHKSAVAAAKTTTTAASKTSVAASSVQQQQQQQVFRCPNCPYNSRRRDAVDNHLRRHASVSGVRQAHGCAHCDYSVAQAHILRDHVKMHFAATEAARPLADAFLSPDVAVKVRVAEATERVLFDDNNADEDDDDDDDEADNSDTVVGGDCDSNGTKDNITGNTGTTVE